MQGLEKIFNLLDILGIDSNQKENTLECESFSISSNGNSLILSSKKEITDIFNEIFASFGNREYRKADPDKQIELVKKYWQAIPNEDASIHKYMIEDADMFKKFIIENLVLCKLRPARIITFKPSYSDTPIELAVIYHCYNSGNLACELRCKMDEDDLFFCEPYAIATVNLEHWFYQDYDAHIDENNVEGIGKCLEENGIAIPTGGYGRSGYCKYPHYQFNLNDEEKARIEAIRKEINK